MVNNLDKKKGSYPAMGRWSIAEIVPAETEVFLAELIGKIGRGETIRLTGSQATTLGRFNDVTPKIRVVLDEVTDDE